MSQVLNRWLKRINALETLTWNVRLVIRDREQLAPLIGQFQDLLEEHFGPRLAQTLLELKRLNVPDRSFGKILEFLETDGKLMLLETLEFFTKHPARPLRSSDGMFPKDLTDFAGKVLQRLDAERAAVESLLAVVGAVGNPPIN